MDGSRRASPQPSPESSLLCSLPREEREKELSKIAQAQTQFKVARRKKGSFKGYSVWVNDGRTHKKVSEQSREAVGYEKDYLPACTLSGREAVISVCKPRNLLKAAIGWFTNYFQSEDLKQYLSLIDEYRKLRSQPGVPINTLQSMRAKLQSCCGRLINEYDDDETIRNFFSNEYRLLVENEPWHNVGLIDGGKGEFYLPENEVAEKRVVGFAKGASSTLDKVVYRVGEEGEEVAVLFRPGSSKELVLSQAADRYGLEEALNADRPEGEKVDIRSITAEEALLANRAVAFCELDSVLGIGLTPPTWYGFHEGKHGSCQELVKDAKSLVSKGWVPANERQVNQIKEDLLGTYDGSYEGICLRFKEDQNLTEEEKALLPREKRVLLGQKYNAGHIEIMTQAVTDIACIDSGKPEFQKQMANAQLLDFVAGSVDRNRGNIVYTEDGPKLVDNDLCLFCKLISTGPDPLRTISTPIAFSASVSIPARIDRKTAEHLASVDCKEVLFLANLHRLGVADRAALLDRFLAMQFVCRRLIAGLPLEPDQITEPEAFQEYRTRVAPFQKGEVRLVDRWNMATWKEAHEDPHSYIRRHILDGRKGAIEEFIQANSKQFVASIPGLIKNLGPKQLGEVLGEMHEYYANLVLEQYSKTFSADSEMDRCQAVILAVHLSRTKLNKGVKGGDQDKQAYDCLMLILGEPETAEKIASALYYADRQNLLSSGLFELLMNQLLKLSNKEPLEGKPSWSFKKEIAPVGWQAPPGVVSALRYCHRASIDDCSRMSARLIHQLKLWSTFQLSPEEQGSAEEIDRSRGKLKARNKLREILKLTDTDDTTGHRNLQEYLEIRRQICNAADEEKDKVILRSLYPNYQRGLNQQEDIATQAGVEAIKEFCLTDLTYL